MCYFLCHFNSKTHVISSSAVFVTILHNTELKYIVISSLNTYQLMRFPVSHKFTVFVTDYVISPPKLMSSPVFVVV